MPTYPVVPLVPGLTQADPTTPTQKVNVKASNTSPTLADGSEVVSLSPNNTGLPVNMPVIVQKANAVSTGSVASLAAVFTNANVKGNSIIVVCGAGSNGTLSVTDTNSNTYVSAVSGANSTTFEAQIFYATNVLAGANTVTVATTSSSSVAVQVYEVSGLLASVGALGQSSSGSGTGTTGSTSNLAAGSPNSLIFLGVAVGTTAEAITAVSGTNWSADSSQNTTTPSGLFSFGSLSLALDNTGPITPQATIAASKPWAAVAAVFKPVTLGIAGTVHLGGWNYTHIASATTTQVKTGPGVVHAVVLGTLVASSSIELDDALSHTTPVISTITPPATVTSVVPFTVTYDVAFSTGLSVTTVGASPDYTIVWR